MFQCKPRHPKKLTTSSVHSSKSSGSDLLAVPKAIAILKSVRVLGVLGVRAPLPRLRGLCWDFLLNMAKGPPPRSMSWLKATFFPCFLEASPSLALWAETRFLLHVWCGNTGNATSERRMKKERFLILFSSHPSIAWDCSRCRFIVCFSFLSTYNTLKGKSWLV